MDGFILSLDAAFLKDLVFQLVNTLILCAALSYILYKPVTKFLSDRKERIAGQISSAKEQLEGAEKLKAEYEQKLKAIEKERGEILDLARTKASEKEQEIISEAKKEAETIKNRAMMDIQREKEKAKDEVKKQIIEISSLMAGKFITASIDAKQQEKLADEFISELEGAKWPS